ncbi:MAG: hypothetical protein V1843_01900 [bacterium]
MYRILACLIIFMVMFAPSAFAASASQQTTVSVTVNAVFSLTLDTSTIDFGTVSTGEFKEIPPGSGYHNKVTCSSNNGNIWRLLIQADSDLIAGVSSIPVNNMKWLSVYASGSGTVNHPSSQGYVDFALSPELVYESTQSEGANLPNGTDVQFKYAMYMPQNQPAGTYQTTILYTMTE